MQVAKSQRQRQSHHNQNQLPPASPRFIDILKQIVHVRRRSQRILPASTMTIALHAAPRASSAHRRVQPKKRRPSNHRPRTSPSLSLRLGRRRTPTTARRYSSLPASLLIHQQNIPAHPAKAVAFSILIAASSAAHASS
jgi:hypothetical protein